MSAYVIDSELFRDQFSTPEMRAIFDDRRTVQAWLDVEVALAEVEAELGIIPSEAAVAINEVGDAALYDLAQLKHEMDRTSHPIVPSTGRSIRRRSRHPRRSWRSRADRACELNGKAGTG